MKLSIITINYNNRAGLMRTLKSVKEQDALTFEHVIIDGASTDGSVYVIKAYSKERANVILLSEPDTGIYNAMNKGARLASGEYCLFLNSGDELYSDNVVSQFLSLDITSEIVQGYLARINEDTRVSTLKRIGEKERIS
ncbi:MAG: glycosyltransferase [Akkermansiaceae bacterium]|nr:glycosyltransferase [Akkermansiaceae bacterium]